MKGGTIRRQLLWKLTTETGQAQAEIGVRFVGPDKLLHLIGLGEPPTRLGRGFADRWHRDARAVDDFSNGDQAVPLILHDLFSHVPQTRLGNARQRPLGLFGTKVLERRGRGDPEDRARLNG